MKTLAIFLTLISTSVCLASCMPARIASGDGYSMISPFSKAELKVLSRKHKEQIEEHREFCRTQRYCE